MAERTFIAIKPDGVKRNLIGKIITRFEEKGYKIIGLKMLHPTEEIAAKHYLIVADTLVRDLDGADHVATITIHKAKI